MSMLIPGNKPDFRPYPAVAANRTNEAEPPLSVIPWLQIFRWGIFFVIGYMLYGAMLIIAFIFMADALPESGGLRAVLRLFPTWLLMGSWLPYLVGAILINRRRHLAAWLFLGGAAMNLVSALQHNSSITWSAVVIGVPASVGIMLLRQPDVRTARPAAQTRPLSSLDSWSRHTLAIISAGYVAFAYYQYTGQMQTILFPFWLLLLPIVVVVTTVIPTGPYLLAIRLIPDDRRNAVALLAIGIALNVLLALAGSRDYLLIAPITVLAPAIIAVLQSRERGREGS